MTTTRKTLTSLALATAALTATTLATTGIASAHNSAIQQLLHSGALHKAYPPAFGHGLPVGFPGHGPVLPPHGFGGNGPPRISCGLPCEGKPIWGGHPPINHDPGYGRDRWHWHYGYRDWRFPVVYSGGYAPGCVYAYKWRTSYVPGFGLARTIVKVCEAI
jgi:hypothetical protein